MTANQQKRARMRRGWWRNAVEKANRGKLVSEMELEAYSDFISSRLRGSLRAARRRKASVKNFGAAAPLQQEHVTSAGHDKAKNPNSSPCKLAQTAPRISRKADRQVAAPLAISPAAGGHAKGGRADGQCTPNQRSASGRHAKACTPSRSPAAAGHAKACTPNGHATSAGHAKGGSATGQCTPSGKKPGHELNDHGVRMLIVAVVERAVEDYRDLVQRGRIVDYKALTVVDDRGQPLRHRRLNGGYAYQDEAQKLADFFKPGGTMDKLLLTAGIEINPNLIREKMGIA